MRHFTTLSNHLRIVSEDLKDRQSASLGIWIGGGGRYEADNVKGVAHFLEHMAFKGSRSYACERIKQLIEGVGGNLNAFTSEEETCYYAKIPARSIERAFDVLSDICFFPSLTKKDLEKERTVILEEIKMYHDLPQYYVNELLDALLWPGHPLGKSLAGSPETVSALKSDDLKQFHSRFYAPQNAVIAACGHIDHDALVDLVGAKLGKLKMGQKTLPSKAPKDQKKPGAHFYHKDTEQMHLAIGYLALESNHPDYYAQAILNVILGGNMSSRLFTEVREKRGLAYSVASGTKSLDDTGAFIVRAGVDNAKIADALQVILAVLDKVSAKGVSAAEFKRAKEYYLGQFLLGLEDTLEHMLWLGSVIISEDKVKTWQDVVKKVNAVAIADIQRVARHVFARHRLNVAVIGPLTPALEKTLTSVAE